VQVRARDGIARSGHSERADGQGERSLAERPNEQADEGGKHRSEVANQLNGIPRIADLTEHPERSAHERVLSALRAKDGVLFGSQVRLGSSFGWSKTCTRCCTSWKPPDECGCR
jgi:hypothetical protein